MNHDRLVVERQLWIAVVAALATAAGWLALMNAALLLHALGPRLDEWIAMARVLARCTTAFAPLAVPLAAALWAGVVLIAWVAQAGRESSEGAQRV